MTALLLLGASLLLMLACGMFVAAEFSLVTVDRATVDSAAAGGDASAQGVQSALKSLSTQLSGAQVGITITNLAIGFLAEPAIAQLVDGPLLMAGVSERAVTPISIGIGLTVATFFTMLIGELVPKNLALSVPMATARATQRFQRGFTKVMAWPIRRLNNSANSIVRRLGVEPQEELRSARSSSELASLVQRSAVSGTLDAETADLMERSVEFGTRTASEIMTPRVRTSSITEAERAAAVIELARHSGHSRFPVLDHEGAVVGTVHVKHAVAVPVHERATTRVRRIMVKPTLVPDSLRLDPLLALLRQDGFQMAVVIDEYGGQAGIVTLEDVVEEIVGDIADEHDRWGERARQRRNGTWSVSGLLRPDEVEDLTGWLLPEHEHYDTVAGLVTHTLGRLARAGDRAEVEVPVRDGHGVSETHVMSVVVERMDGRRIDRVLLAPPVAPSPPSPAAHLPRVERGGVS